MTEKTKALGALLGVFLLGVAVIFNVAVENADETVMGPWGEITIEYIQPPLLTGTDTVLGVWYAHKRLVQIDASLRPTMRRGVRAHELCHAAISDAGLTLPDSTEDNVCNAMELWAISQK